EEFEGAQELGDAVALWHPNHGRGAEGRGGSQGFRVSVPWGYSSDGRRAKRINAPRPLVFPGSEQYPSHGCRAEAVDVTQAFGHSGRRQHEGHGCGRKGASASTP